nr:hypothetical protein [Paraglaciecola sp. 20A4]
MFYFSIGLFSALTFTAFWWFYKDRVERPASPSLMLLRAGTYILVWPVLYWKWFKSADKTRFITDQDYIWPSMAPGDPAFLTRKEQKAQLEAQKVQQEWEAFVDALPQCGSHIMYKGTDIYGERLDGRFIFETTDLLPVLFDEIHPEPFVMEGGDEIDETDVEALQVRAELNEWINDCRKEFGEEHYIYRWLRTYDPTLFVCNVVPTSFNRFEYIASDMIEAGKGQVHCKTCSKVYAASEIKRADEGTSGWVFGVMHCPNGHLLARCKKIHFMRASPD